MAAPALRLVYPSTPTGSEPAPAGDRYGPHICLACHGYRWMRVNVPYGDPKFGQLVRCERPHADPEVVNPTARRYTGGSGGSED